MLNYPKLTVLSCWIFTAMNARGEDALNLNFLQGVAKHNIPEILSSDKKYPAGKYVVDVVFNRESFGRQILDVKKEDGDVLCLSTEWIARTGLPLRLSTFEKQYDPLRQCYQLGNFPDVRIDLDYGAQALRFSVPQIALKGPTSGEGWDYGIPGFRLSWSGNASKSNTSKEQVYGNFDLNANIGRWVFAGKTSGFNDQGFTTSEATLSTVIAPVRGKLQVGKTLTASTLLPDFSFYGVSLRSDSNMVPWGIRGYAPQISGVAATNARVTVSQGGYAITSEIVPPGPFLLNNIRPVSNGDLTVTIEEEDGSKMVRTYPITTLPTLLRSGDFNYNIVVGTREDSEGNSQDVKDIFTMGSLDYGFVPFTLNIATILHSNYQSAGVGVTKDFGVPGALSASINASRSVFENDFTQYNSRNIQTGVSGLIKYAKGLTTSTNLQLMSYRYTGEKYVDFSGFEPRNLYSRDNRKERYEAIITQGFGNTYINASGWMQSYRDSNDTDSGANLNISAVYEKVSLSFGANYGKYQFSDSEDFGLSMSLSVPFSAFEHPHYNTNSVSYNRTGKTTFNTGVSGNVDDRLSYNLNSGLSENVKSASAYAGMSFDKVQTGMSISQSNGITGMSFSASGSVIATQPTGMLFSREQNNTIAVVRLKDIPGVRFNGSAPTNKKGVTAFYISPYNKNDIRINTEQVPDNIELMNSAYSVVPTERAIVFRDFAHTEIKRYIIKVIGRDGKPVMAGSQARTEQDINAGFVANGGILLVNVLAEPKEIIVRQQGGMQCQFSMQGMVAGKNKIEEVRCE
ncbi:TPA: PefC/AfrB family outer membrane usher protein [Salmonella enterica subsp. enterica serovar Eastbourne]|nr:outer membrane usher protein PefC [Salmonella enterica]HAE5116304.1 PefC/AfrB family outer membrane usher protein [Salmonella enterica subsp. enterica serovar Eastbourne]HDN7459752.1 PefC/AfrB family outer membrane usher protein [Salmonella enterica subsp. enterica serovar Eastbourne]HDN7576804.1 PefC/AfrB family outer membrane usher protein [Salmonella enterica subsp. enterica serovar Eastbourne]